MSVSFRLNLKSSRRLMWTGWRATVAMVTAGRSRVTRRRPPLARNPPSMRCASRCTCCWRRPSAWPRPATPLPAATTTSTPNTNWGPTTPGRPSPTPRWWPALRGPSAETKERFSGCRRTGRTCTSAVFPSLWVSLEYYTTHMEA